MISERYIANSEFWRVVERVYDFVLCFEIDSGKILRKSGFDKVCVLLDAYKDYYALMDEYKNTYVNDLTREEFNKKTSMAYLNSHELVKFIGLENIENDEQRWYEYTIVIDENVGAMFIQDVHEMQSTILELEMASKKDYLTNTLNRRALDDFIDDRIVENLPFAVVFADLDNFKHINDTYGHGVGDQVLRETALRIKSILPKNSTIARYGGDEFIVCINSIGSFNDVIEDLETLISEMDNKLDCGVKVSLSIGVSFYPEHGVSRKMLFHAADMALYNAKRKGKKTFEIADDK